MGSFSHTHSSPTTLSLSEKLLEPIAMAYLLCIMGCLVPEDWLGLAWLGGETRGKKKVESKEGGKAELCSVKTADLDLRCLSSLL